MGASDLEVRTDAKISDERGMHRVPKIVMKALELEKGDRLEYVFDGERFVVEKKDDN